MEILSLGKKIKRRRKELNMTLKDLAGSRITPGQISLVESGRSNPSMDLLEYLAEVLDTSIEYLMESEETQAEKICVYYEQVAESYIISKDLICAEEYIEKSLYYTEKFNLELQRAKNLFLRGKLYMEKKELPLAQQLFLSASSIFSKNNSYNEVAKSFLCLAEITMELKAFHSTISYLGQAEKIYTDNNIGNDFMVGEIYFQMAQAYFKLEDTKNAKEYSLLAREKFEEVYDKEKYAKKLLLLSEQYNKAGDLSNAIKYSKKTLEIYRDLQKEEKIVSIENNLGKLFSGFDNLEEAHRHFEIAKNIRLRNDKESIVDILMNICENHIKTKNIEKCEEVLQQITDLISEEDVDAFIDKNILMIRILGMKEMYEDVEEVLLYTFKYAKSRNAKKKTAKLAMILGKFYIDCKKNNEATMYLNEGVNILKELDTSSN